MIFLQKEDGSGQGIVTTINLYELVYSILVDAFTKRYYFSKYVSCTKRNHHVLSTPRESYYYLMLHPGLIPVKTVILCEVLDEHNESDTVQVRVWM